MAQNNDLYTSPEVERALEEMFGKPDPVLDAYFADLHRISNALYNQRTSKGWTQSEMASHLGVTQEMVSKYESGGYNFTLKTLHSIFAKLDCVYSSVVRPTDKNIVYTQSPFVMPAINKRTAIAA